MFVFFLNVLTPRRETTRAGCVCFPKCSFSRFCFQFFLYISSFRGGGGCAQAISGLEHSCLCFFLNVLTPRRENTRAGSAVFLAFVSNFFVYFVNFSTDFQASSYA